MNMKAQKKTDYFYGIIMLLAVFTFSCTDKKEGKLHAESVSPLELANWKALDLGQTSVENDYLILEELPGAGGYFLVSPENYTGDVIVNYQLQALSESSVMILLLAASDNGQTNQLTLPPPNADAQEFWDWRSKMNHYNITFNNESHGFTPFMYKNINELERGFHIRKTANVMKPGRWYDIEAGRVKDKVWLKVDGEFVFNYHDPAPLLGGHLIFRISGTSGENVILAKSAIRSLVIHHE